MTAVTDRQRSIINAAASFALWRAPGDRTATLLASLDAPAEGPVFGAAAPQPSFAMAQFSQTDGNRPVHIRADLLDGPDGLTLRDGAKALLRGAPAEFHAQGGAAAGPAAISQADYEARLIRVIAAIRAGEAEKVVISRAEPVTVGGLDLIAAFDALSRAYPPAFVALVSSTVTGTWLLATPETLLQVDQDSVRTMALAGTQWPDDPTDLSGVTWPEKIVTEQAIVATELRATLARVGLADVTETPARTVQAANLCHLRSDFSAPRPSDAVLADLLARLHPTSAVCGMPRAAARAVIAAEEGATRGYYTGYLGPCHLGGATRLFVNLRSARVVGDIAYLHVGGGIVAASDPRLEWQETVEKAKTVGAHLQGQASIRSTS